MPSSPYGDVEFRDFIRTITREKVQQRDATCLQITHICLHGLQSVIEGELSGMTNLPQPCQCGPAPIQS